MSTELTGLALREAVATKVMGAKPRRKKVDVSTWADAEDIQEVNGFEYPSGVGFYMPRDLPKYDTDIRAAWQVVEKMSATTKEFWNFQYFSTGATATYEYEGGRDFPYPAGEYESGVCLSMPEAICRAALAALEAAPEQLTKTIKMLQQLNEMDAPEAQ